MYLVTGKIRKIHSPDRDRSWVASDSRWQVDSHSGKGAEQPRGHHPLTKDTEQVSAWTTQPLKDPNIQQLTIVSRANSNQHSAALLGRVDSGDCWG